MRVEVHAFVGLILSLLLFILLPSFGVLASVLVFFSSLGLDIDYLLYNFYRNGNFNFIETYKFAKSNGQKYRKLSHNEKKKYFRAVRVFHGVEILILLFVLGYFLSCLFYFVFIGVFLHLVMDWIHEFKYNLRHDKFSIILNFVRFKKLKQV